MIRLGRTVAFLLFCLPLLSTARSSSPEALAHDLKGKTFLLRGKYIEDNLAFDAQGNVTSSATTGPFSFSAIKIEKVHLTGTTLEIDGHRGALINLGTSYPAQPHDIQFVPLADAVHIAVARDPAHPEGLSPLLAKIFAVSIDDALTGKTDAARKGDLFTLAFLHGSTQPPATASLSTGTDVHGAVPSTVPTASDSPGTTPSSDLDPQRIYKPNMVSAPRVIHSVDPQYTKDAASKKISGICIVSVIVDTNGFPVHIHIVRPLDPGLDQMQSSP